MHTFIHKYICMYVWLRTSVGLVSHRSLCSLCNLTYIHTHTFIHTYMHTFIHKYIHDIHKTHGLSCPTQTRKSTYRSLSEVETACEQSNAAQYIHTYIRTYIHTYIHTTHTHTLQLRLGKAHAALSLKSKLHASNQMRLSTYIQTYVHTYIHTHTHTCTHTHKYTATQTRKT
jgi:hypothetical protein